MKHSASNLIEKVERYKRLWARIGRFRWTADLMPIQLRETIEEMNWWEKIMPEWLGGDRSTRSELEHQISEFEKHSERRQTGRNAEIAVAADIANRITDKVSESEQISLIYWRDEVGEHSYYTSDLQLVPEKEIKSK